jgi:hypothetical protein
LVVQVAAEMFQRGEERGQFLLRVEPAYFSRPARRKSG